MTLSWLTKIYIFQFLFLGMALFISKSWILCVRNCSMCIYSTGSKSVALWVSQTTYFNQMDAWGISSYSGLNFNNCSHKTYWQKRFSYDLLLEKKSIFIEKFLSFLHSPSVQGRKMWIICIIWAILYYLHITWLYYISYSA